MQVVAVGHSLLVTGYYLITRHKTYLDLGNYFDERPREYVKRRAVQHLAKLGFQVELRPVTAQAEVTSFIFKRGSHE